IGAGHKTCGVARQEQGGLGDLFWLTESIHQVLWARQLPRRGHVAVAQHQTTGLDRARRERVDSYVLRGMVDSHGLGELDDCSFRRAISGPRWGGDAT